MDYYPEDVFMGVLPFFHIYGQVVVMLSGLKCGAKTVTVPKFDPQMYLSLAEKHKVWDMAYSFIAIYIMCKSNYKHCITLDKSHATLELSCR